MFFPLGHGVRLSSGKSLYYWTTAAEYNDSGRNGSFERTTDGPWLQVDIPLLYMPVTEEALEKAYAFYEIWYEAPGAVKASWQYTALCERSGEILG